ncbi:MAG: Uma2 family endonuclease [Candidatus Acetothermia bacterium]|jgi:Uma2 family endonuclease|nr:Uma2 family endonuclease [Candidatus Acetothermia bacterium]MDH7505985.1 Uma2 family endonuclease [Candidatus Acetothermia bacterium]
MMAEARTKIKFTYEDYKSLPESETKRYELLGGELVMVPSPTEYHQRISGNLEFILRQFIRERALGQLYYAPLDVVLGQGEEREVTQPDIFFISKERSQIIAEKEIQGAPDLVVEIISPGTEARDRGYKKTLYARHGVKEYWIVDPEAETVEVLLLGERGFARAALYGKADSLRSPLLSGLEIKLEEVFQ